jgi:aspartate aminotransferase
MTISSATETSVHVNLNPRVRDLRPSATLVMNERARELTAQGRKIYRLGFGQSPFPVPLPVVEALKSNAFQKDYLPVRGLPELRSAVADFHRRLHGIEASGDDILIGPGSKELIFLTQLAYDADLAVPAPSWVSYEPQANLLGRDVHWIQTSRESGWRLTPDDLEKHCREEPERPRLLILNYPNNPSGLTYAAGDLKALAAVARKYGILILADEIYGEVHHTAGHVSIARYYPDGTIVSGGLSKWCGAGGWRLGTLCFPPALRWLQDAVACIASETYSAAGAPIQHAAVTAYRGGSEIDRYLQQSRRIIRSVGRIVSDRLREGEIHVAPPEGGFYLFPDFTSHGERLRTRGIATGQELCERLLVETGVALLPGSDFGRPANELTCRLAYVDFNGEKCLAATEAVPIDRELGESFLAENCGDVVAAAELIVEWLQRDD